MIAVDTNLLVYAHRQDSEWHDRAYKLLEGLAEGVSAWAIPWPCVHEFLAIVTHPRIYDPPTPLGQALDQVDAWFESPSLALLSEDAVYWGVFRDLLLDGKVQGPKVHDARVASLSITAGVSKLWTADRDFSSFAELEAENPLIS